jgi:8-oxo-dGTP pyrophosphatase MutT (NUDIX family)
VLVPLFVDGGALWALFTKRSEALARHRGQIAFPGGGADPGEDAWMAALRESEEELGLDRTRVLRLGSLDEREASSGYVVTPCVGAIPWPTDLRPNQAEVAEVFALPLAELANPRLVEEREVRVDGKMRTVLVYHVAGRTIWGLTARILRDLLEKLGLYRGATPL